MYDPIHGVRKRFQRWNVPWHSHMQTSSCFRRQAFLTKDRTRRWYIDAVNRARTIHPFHVWAYVIMPEHVHLLIWPTVEKYEIEEIFSSIKQSASRKAVNYLKRENPSGLRLLATGYAKKPYQFWQDGGGHDRNIRTAGALRNALAYIHYNPVRRGLVARPEDWAWSSAADWAGLREGPISIDKQSCIDSSM